MRKNTAWDLAEKGFARAADLNRKNTVRNVISRGRHQENIDWHQCPMIQDPHLPVHDEDGTFFFIVGFSTFGGGDRIPP